MNDNEHPWEPCPDDEPCAHGEPIPVWNGRLISAWDGEPIPPAWQQELAKRVREAWDEGREVIFFVPPQSGGPTTT